MSSDSGVPTYILQSDGLFREGLRLILSSTRFRPHGCAMELDDLTEVPSDRPILFIVGIGADQAVICSKIRNQYPLAFIVAVADESNPRSLTSALEDGANAALFSSVSPTALVSTLQAVVNGKLILIDARLWPLEIQPKAEERLSPPLQDDRPWEGADEPQAGKHFVRTGNCHTRAHRSGRFQQACRAILQNRGADREDTYESHPEKDRSEQSYPGCDLGVEQQAVQRRVRRATPSAHIARRCEPLERACVVYMASATIGIEPCTSRCIVRRPCHRAAAEQDDEQQDGGRCRDDQVRHRPVDDHGIDPTAFAAILSRKASHARRTSSVTFEQDSISLNMRLPSLR